MEPEEGGEEPKGGEEPEEGREEPKGGELLRATRSGALRHGFGLFRRRGRVVAFPAAGRAAQGERAEAAWPGCGDSGSGSLRAASPRSAVRGARPGCAGKELLGPKPTGQAGPGTVHTPSPAPPALAPAPTPQALGDAAELRRKAESRGTLHMCSGDLPLWQ